MKVSIKGTAKQIEAFLNQRQKDKLHDVKQTDAIETQQEKPQEKPESKIETNQDICEWFLQQFTAKLKALGIDVVYEEYSERYNFNLHSLKINKEGKTFTISEIEFKENVELPSAYSLQIPKTESQLDALMFFFEFCK